MLKFAGVLAILAAFLTAGPAQANSLCAHVNTVTQNGTTATANITVLSAPCTVTFQAIDKTGVGHGTVTAKTTVVFTTTGPASLAVTGPCGVDWETDVVQGLGLELYGTDPDLHAQAMTRVACTSVVMVVPQDGTRNIYCSGLTGASLNLLQSQVYAAGSQLYATWTDSTGRVVTVPVTVAPFYQGVGAACLYWPIRFHPTGSRVQSDGSPELDPAIFGYPYWARN